MSDFMYGSICLTDVPKELFKKVENGKVYLNIAVSRKKEVGQFGDTHTIIASVPKDKRKEGDKPIYCGSLKEYVEQKPVTQEQVFDAPVAVPDDLPF